MNDDTIARVTGGASWEAFCDALKSAGATILGPETPAGALDRAEGFRYLSRLTRLSLEMMLEFADPDFPVFYAASHDTIKVFAPNPDTLYLNATVAGDRDYRITGTRGSVPYLSFGTKANRYAIDGTMPSTGELDGADLRLDADGGFEIVLSANPRPGNWLPMAPDSNMVIVRENFLDRAGETPATMRIECIRGPSAPQPLSAGRLDAGLRNAADFVVNTARTLADLTRRFSRRPNELLREPYRELSDRSGGDPNIAYFHGFWSLKEGEALVIESEVPECPYWNFQINNWWMESLDYRYHPVAVNRHSARCNADGSVTMVVAARNPGVVNFLDTAGHSCGTMLLRWISAKHHPQPRCRVVPIEALRPRAKS